MTTKKYLNQISRLECMINNKLAEIAQLRELSRSISAVSTEERVRSTPNFDRIGSTYAKIDEMEKNLDKIIDDFTQKKQKIISQIDSMENENVYKILFSHYIKKKSFEKIAVEMDYSYRQTIRLHGKALQQFEEKFGDEYLEKK